MLIPELYLHGLSEGDFDLARGRSSRRGHRRVDRRGPRPRLLQLVLEEGLVVGDGHLGIWGALRNVYPQAAEQRCWNHKIVNVLAKLPKRQQDLGVQRRRFSGGPGVLVPPGAAGRRARTPRPPRRRSGSQRLRRSAGTPAGLLDRLPHLGRLRPRPSGWRGARDLLRSLQQNPTLAPARADGPEAFSRIRLASRLGILPR